MVDSEEKEGYMFALENIIEYLKTAPKGFILFWVVMLIALVYSFSRAADNLGWLFGK